jgi:hypothetical protein
MRTAAKPVIRGVLDELDDLADGIDHNVLAALRDRLDSARLHVLVAGEATVRAAGATDTTASVRSPGCLSGVHADCADRRARCGHGTPLMPGQRSDLKLRYYRLQDSGRPIGWAISQTWPSGSLK